MRTLLAVVVLSAVAFSQDTPKHRFFDKQAAFSLAGSAAIFAADAVGTCRSLASGGHEDWLPTQSCRGVSLWMVGNSAEQTASAYLLHRWRHHKLERVVEIFGSAGSITAMILSSHSKPSPLPPRFTVGTRVVSVCVGRRC